MPVVIRAERLLCRVLALVALALLGGRVPAAARAQFDAAFGDRLRPGTEQTVDWVLDRAANIGHDEMELVLSLDGGQSYSVRLTAPIAVSDHAVRWRVPALPTEHARLALRAGNDEITESEEILLVSDEFAIASSEDEEELYAVAGEWRTAEALEGAPVRPQPRDIESRDDDGRFAPADSEEDESETAPIDGALRRAPDSDSRAVPATARVRPPISRLPLRPGQPLRL
jgi:hypothetical protein